MQYNHSHPKVNGELIPHGNLCDTHFGLSLSLQISKNDIWDKGGGGDCFA